MSAEYYSEKLDGKNHDRKGFSCGEVELDRYFTDQATQDHRRRVAVPYVLMEAATNRIIGFYTLSMRSIDRDSLPPDIGKRLPYRQVPVVLIGRLAVHIDYHGKGWGWRLLADALMRAAGAGEEVAAYAVIVEAKSDAARAFYEHAGFRALADNPWVLYIAMRSITGK
jgi:GNAT superfamily N-acetyltransferase